MKRIVLLISLITYLSSHAQSTSKLLKEVSQVRVKNIGAIKSNEQVKGYFSFYEYDKSDRQTILYKLNLSDENLNDLGTTDISGTEDLQLISSAFDGTYFCFKFFNSKEKKLELRVYNQQGKQVTNNRKEIFYKEIPTNSKYAGFKMLVSPELNVVEENGFIDYAFENEEDGYVIGYANGAKKSWNKNYAKGDGYKIAVPNYLNGDSKIVLTAVSKVRSGLFNYNTSNFVVGNNLLNGAQAFETELDADNNFILPVNAFFRNDRIILVGLYYPSAKTYTRPPDGFAFVELDRRGKILKKTTTTFHESLGKFLEMEGNELKDDYSLYIHDIVSTSRNTTLIVAEKFKLRKGIDFQNAVIIEYDSAFNMIQAKEIPKENMHNKNVVSAFGASTYAGAARIKMRGEMDFLYTLRDEGNSSVTFSFMDPRTSLDKKHVRIFDQIKYQNGTITADHLKISSEDTDGADFTQVLPAKAGYVLEANYYKKRKELLMRFVKLRN